jgi:hypothetical protein
MEIKHIGIPFALCSKKYSGVFVDDLGSERYKGLGVTERFRDEKPYRVCQKCINIILKREIGPSKKRLFIEVHQVNEHTKDKLESDMDSCKYISKSNEEKFFWKVVDNARFEPKLFDYIQESEEIYMSTSIVPLVSHTSIGSPEVWDKMMKLAVAQNVTGKKVFISRYYDDIEWCNLDKKTLRQSFKKNSLYVRDKEYRSWKQVDMKVLLKEDHWR